MRISVSAVNTAVRYVTGKKNYTKYLVLGLGETIDYQEVIFDLETTDEHHLRRLRDAVITELDRRLRDT